jgi:hypothetical protein
MLGGNGMIATLGGPTFLRLPAYRGTEQGKLPRRQGPQ